MIHLNEKHEYPFEAMRYYEHCVYGNEKAFIMEFCKSGAELIKVSFNSDGVEFVVLLDCRQSVTDGITVGNFLDWVSKLV